MATPLEIDVAMLGGKQAKIYGPFESISALKLAAEHALQVEETPAVMAQGSPARPRQPAIFAPREAAAQTPPGPRWAHRDKMAERGAGCNSFGRGLWTSCCAIIWALTVIGCFLGTVAVKNLIGSIKDLPASLQPASLQKGFYQKVGFDWLKWDSAKVKIASEAAPAAHRNLFATKNETCVFILSTPGSGSSTMVKLLGQAGCEVSGENAGAFIRLARFQGSLLATEHQPRKGEHAEAAWHKVYTYEKVVAAEMSLVREMLNPNSQHCWGFKEIRYGRGPNTKTLAADIDYLKSLCANPKIVFHYRSDFEAEASSNIISRSRKNRIESQGQRACFEAYVAGSQQSDSKSPEGCSCKQHCDDPPPFLHTLEDYIQNTSNHMALFQYPGLPMPMGPVIHSGR